MPSSSVSAGDVPVRFRPGEVDFANFAEAWGGSQSARESIATGMDARAMQLNTAYAADPTMFTEVQGRGRERTFDSALFTPEQMRVRDIGRR